MTNKTLTNKYRPSHFNGVIGQANEIKSILSNLKNGELKPMVLIGERGTGKTTTARLISAYVNCKKEEKNVEKSCDCSNCERVRNGNLQDLIEVDGASNNGVDYVRDLKAKLHYPPSAKCKVIVIDEAHMLTKSAFNALLKVLEEPPKQVLFILATTEPNKIIPTIMSRCNKHYFKLVDNQTLTQFVKNVLVKEGFENKLSDSIIKTIVENGKGSVRDTLSLLNKIIYLDDTEEEDLRQLIGGLDDTRLRGLFLSVFSYDVVNSLIKLKNIFDSGIQPQDLYNSIETYLQSVLVFQYGLSEEADEVFDQIAQLATSKNISDFLQIFWKVSSNTFNLKKLVFDVIILEYCKDYINEAKPKFNLNKGLPKQNNRRIEPEVKKVKKENIFTEVVPIVYEPEEEF